jgi:(2Fe-2S) ferredoxin
MMRSPLELPPLLLVCCCQRDGGVAACDTQGRKVFLALIAALETRDDDDTHVVASSCLGHCSIGGAVVCNPESGTVWTNVAPEDSRSLLLELAEVRAKKA